MIGTSIGPVFVAGRPVRGFGGFIVGMLQFALWIIVACVTVIYYAIKYTALAIIWIHGRVVLRRHRRALATPPTGPATIGIPTP